MEGFGGGECVPDDLRALRDQLSTIEFTESRKRQEETWESERKQLREKIKKKGFKPCA